MAFFNAKTKGKDQFKKNDYGSEPEVNFHNT